MAVISSGVYLLFLQPQTSCLDNVKNGTEEGTDCGGACAPCELKNLKLTVEETKTFPAGGQLSNLLIKINNPSANYGLSNFEYRIDVFDSLGAKVTTVSKTASIGPLEKKYIVIPALAVGEKNVGEVRFSGENLVWQKKETLIPYDVRVKDSLTEVSGDMVTVSGTLLNNSSSNFRTVEVSAILYDKTGTITNVSVTELEAVAAFSETPFKVFFPKIDPAFVDVYKTQIFLEPING